MNWPVRHRCCRGKQEKSAEEEKTHTRTSQQNGGKYMGICLFEPKGGAATAEMGLRPRHRLQCNRFVGAARAASVVVGQPGLTVH